MRSEEEQEEIDWLENRNGEIESLVESHRQTIQEYEDLIEQLIEEYNSNLVRLYDLGEDHFVYDDEEDEEE
ncbi:hypothetical protein [uncultured Cardiobacterium sp.]|jgi:hypothetical protein|uniref:hypothetical protein n=1 Tax=uncultured Cardiobacterium sp. TaxID=417619 RepID=UPI002603852F|nr:hypothetical protein [uncultured Cardiobacterium sp.]